MSDEDHQKERLNRKLIELLNELRIVIPGVQVLFAFLLILPFNSGFVETHGIYSTGPCMRWLSVAQLSRRRC